MACARGLSKNPLDALDTEYVTRVAFAILERLSTTHLRNWMKKDMKPSMDLLDLLFPLIKCIDEELYNHLMKSQVSAYFAISWLLTWFAHDVCESDIILRIFDFLITSNPFDILYLIAAIVINNREEI